MFSLATLCCHGGGPGSRADNSGGGTTRNELRAEVSSGQPENGLHCAGDTHTTCVSGPPLLPTVEPCPMGRWGMVQKRPFLGNSAHPVRVRPRGAASGGSDRPAAQ